MSWATAVSWVYDSLKPCPSCGQATLRWLTREEAVQLDHELALATRWRRKSRIRRSFFQRRRA